MQLYGDVNPIKVMFENFKFRKLNLIYLTKETKYKLQIKLIHSLPLYLIHEFENTFKSREYHSSIVPDPSTMLKVTSLGDFKF